MSLDRLPGVSGTVSSPVRQIPGPGCFFSPSRRTTLRMEASKGGDMIYSQGTFAMTTTDAKTKKVKTENGKYLTVYRKQADGSWRLAADAAVADPAM